jgi:hypothetical protein
VFVESIRECATRSIAFLVKERRESMLSGRVFLVGLAIVYVFFFVSLASQVHGLVGSEGILPADAFFRRVLSRFDAVDAFWRLPSLYWISRTDAMLTALLVVGLGAALALFTLVVVRPARAAAMARAILVVLYATTLSFVAVGQSFLSFQWDMLLIEGTVLAFFFANSADRAPRAPSRAAVFLVRFLVVKLMMSSGLGKLASGDATWRSLDALAFHFFTQPLPNPLAIFFAHAPTIALTGGTLLTLVVQIAFPPLLFIGPRARAVALIVLTLHQFAIAATGNFAYFNVLTLVLLAAASDDDVLLRLPVVGRRIATIGDDTLAPRDGSGRFRVFAHLMCVVLLFTLSLHAFVDGVARRTKLMTALAPLVDALAPLRLTSRYGLFTVMTTTRHEIVLEGTRDGRTWSPFHLPHKPGPVDRWPRFVAPLQPRLDWQFWFAALGPVERNPFVLSTMRALVEGKSDVRALFDDPPFADAPPRAVRALLYDYELAPLERLRADGLVWERTFIGPYAPVIGVQFVDDGASPSVMP